MDTCKDAKKTKKSFKKKNPVGYVLGSFALFAVGCVTIPVAMTKVTGMLYKATNSTAKDDDDWGPVIEKKSPPKNTSTEEKDEEEQ